MRKIPNEVEKSLRVGTSEIKLNSLWEDDMLESWLNEPKAWSANGDELIIRTDLNTDFWNKTFYGFTHANGHFRYCNTIGDFTAEVKITAHYEHLYDQAGLMIMHDSENWLKCGIEYTDGGLHFSTVVTRHGFSDWSQQKLLDAASQNFGVRLSRFDNSLRVDFSARSQPWTMARLAMLPMEAQVKIGVMCCTPSREGLEVKFKGFVKGQVIPRELHV